MISLKYSSPAIRQLAPDALCVCCQTLMLKIHVITGWVVPSNEMMDILIDQLMKTLVENYGDLNSDEIEFAFRATGTTVKDWGKSMNLALIDEVLIPYRNKRTEISTVEEKLLPPPGQKVYSNEELINENRAVTEACYQRFLVGDRTYFPYQLMKDVLTGDGLMKEGTDVGLFFHQCAGSGLTNLYKKTDEPAD